ncbi:MAG: hypothetical protein LBU05_04970, partial [Bifidobacteriaceae bacterium]|nr:hypothetical protein [Bifidobacteriaceae bacterium]
WPVGRGGVGGGWTMPSDRLPVVAGERSWPVGRGGTRPLGWVGGWGVWRWGAVGWPGVLRAAFGRG